MDIKYALREITDRRRDELDAALERWRDALDSDGRLYDAYTAYQTEAIKKASGENNDLTAARERLESEKARLGFTREKLEPPPHCKKCGDTGYCNGSYCDCVIKLAISMDPESLCLPQTDFDTAFKSAPAAMKPVYAAAKEYMEADGKPFFIIGGTSGIGKTVLLSAVATSLMKRGRSAVTVSAFEFLRRAKDYHTQFAIENYIDRYTPMLECDVLAIDDLGTETMLKNITKEYLYTLITERRLGKKRTVISTNLTPAELLARYGESIFSRLYDKNMSVSFMITGKNNRIAK